MFSILVKKIIITDGNSFNDLLEDKGKVYTFLNPVSYLTALENKELFASFDGIFADGSILVVWGIERSGFFNGQGKWAKGFENQMV